MIYLDNAAGSHPKAPGVEAAMIEALKSWGANPGRGSYAFARRTGDMVEQVRGKLAALIHAPDPGRVAFTSGATMSLNALVLGYASRLSGGEVIVSSMEHNALLRPLYLLEERGLLRIRMIAADAAGYIESRQVAEAVNGRTRLIALSMASNVCGSVQPVAEVGALARRAGLPLLIDASQSAGLLDIDVEAMGISMLAVAGHKYLLGPSGVGALWAAPEIELAPLLHGGTGRDSEQRAMPAYWPARMEAGSLNTAGIAGLGAGLDFLAEQGIPRLYRRAMALTGALERGLRQLPGLTLQKQENESRPRAPLLSFTLEGLAAGRVAELLDRRGVCVRSGYHCAPEAHRTLGTFEEGTVRLSPSWANGEQELEQACSAIADVAYGRMR
ncbi:MAG: aminotransferase class V-fold PLP-dependent enzyme [Firmicutes bacterium]|nr:aminotransferase class V-fold PLP-dependent enzyme [Bacillota bacterium]